jgi:hypothetical protein
MEGKDETDRSAVEPHDRYSSAVVAAALGPPHAWSAEAAPKRLDEPIVFHDPDPVRFGLPAIG